MKKMLTIIISAFLLIPVVYAQQKTITGTVTNKTTKAVLEGVTVQSGKATVLTDANGRFSIEASAGDLVTFSYVGMKSVPVNITYQPQQNW